MEHRDSCPAGPLGPLGGECDVECADLSATQCRLRHLITAAPCPLPKGHDGDHDWATDRPIIGERMT